LSNHPPNNSPSKLCFVVSPIGIADSEQRIHADWVLERIIKPVMAGFEGYCVKRADEDARPGIIASQMINDLLTTELVIADLSFHNPNVFYEIGIRHMVRKPIIHMHQTTWSLPFDVIPHRAVSFDLRKSEDLDAACAKLRSAVEAVLAEGYVVENPVTNARGRIELQEHATPAQQLLNDQMQAMLTQMQEVQSRLTRLESPPPVYESLPRPLYRARGFDATQGFSFNHNTPLPLRMAFDAGGGPVTRPSEESPTD
jgi:hypothetical protein